MLACPVHPPEVEKYLEVSNAPLRERLLDLRVTHGLSDNALATMVGVSSGTSVARDLGLRRTSEGHLKKKISYEMAQKYAVALGMSPREAGV